MVKNTVEAHNYIPWLKILFFLKKISLGFNFRHIVIPLMYRMYQLCIYEYLGKKFVMNQNLILLINTSNKINKIKSSTNILL